MADGESRNCCGSTRPNADTNVIGIDLYNQSLTGGVAKTLSNKATDSDHIPCVLIYAIDMGGGKPSVSIMKDVSPTLATTHYGEPAVYDARGNGGGYVCPTITGEHQNRVTDYTALVLSRTTTEITDHPNRATVLGQTEQH